MNYINVDIHIGAKIRSRRHALGMSQTDLGEMLGITFQQIQKYEKGHNKITASRLLELADIMDISIAYFFDNLNNNQNDNSNTKLKVAEEISEFIYNEETDDLNGRETITLVKIYNNIPNKDVRKKLLIFLKSLAQD